MTINKANLRNYKHGLTKTPEWAAWKAMKQRCLNPANDSYEYYGGRGIKVCDRWLGANGFINFLKDLGERPENLSLDRIDNNGNYEPHNVRWASKVTQQNNRRRYRKKSGVKVTLKFTVEMYDLIEKNAGETKGNVESYCEKIIIDAISKEL